MMRFLRGHSRAQSVTEMAMAIPVLVWLMLGSVDLGRAFYLDIAVSSASRAGMRMGVIDSVVDIGAAARSEPNTAIPNSAAVWGATAAGGLNGDCTSAAQSCGDLTGCPATAFATGQLACFAVRKGPYDAVAGNCNFTASLWNTRPLPGSNDCLDVRVVYRFVPTTPMIAQLGTNGAFYLTIDTSGLELY